MMIQSTYRGRTYKEVSITHDFDAEPKDDREIALFAMHRAGETEGSLQGWKVDRPAEYPHLAVVTLYTD